MGYPKYLDEYETEALVLELQRRLCAAGDGVCDYCEQKLGSEPACRFPERHRGVGRSALISISFDQGTTSEEI